MLVGEAINIEVTKQDIVQANEDFCPITKSLSSILDENPENIRVGHTNVIVFDNYDRKKDVYNYEGEVAKQFLDSWNRYLYGSDEELKAFEFVLVKRK